MAGDAEKTNYPAKNFHGAFKSLSQRTGIPYVRLRKQLRFCDWHFLHLNSTNVESGNILPGLGWAGKVFPNPVIYSQQAEGAFVYPRASGFGESQHPNCLWSAGGFQFQLKQIQRDSYPEILCYLRVQTAG